jgi:ERCC4-type nuclease
MYLIIDARETRSGILDLAREEPGLQYETMTLETGDYIVDNKVVFERKTLPDFLVSIQNGRFFRQSYAMANALMPYILILEGTRDSVKNSQMKREAVQGALIHISVFLGIPVLRSANIQETFKIMMMTGHQLEKYSHAREGRAYLPAVKAKMSRGKRARLQMIQHLPGIGHKRARAMLEAYPRRWDIFCLDEEGFMKIEGIGKKTAKEIVQFIHG